MARYDLLLKGGRVIDPSQDLDRVCDVAFAGGKVAAVEPEIAESEAEAVRRVAGRLVVPGIIDFHTHVYWLGASLSIDADDLARRSGTTTWLDVGTAGPGNFAGFKHHVIDRSKTRILAYLHISFTGVYAFSHEVMVGESVDLRLLNPKVCARVAKQYPDDIRGIKVRIGHITSGDNGLAPLHLAIEAADFAGLPVMCHLDVPPPTVAEVMATLRPGDILTHCFRPFPNAPIHGDGRIRDPVLAAREKGVIFDIAHGKGSFSWRTAHAMLEQGFKPDVISSDVHALCINGPAYDNLVTMSKFLHLGMDLGDVVRAATETPAKLLGRPDLGSLRPGSAGDAAVLELREGRFDYDDVEGVREVGDVRLFCDAVVVGGALYHEAKDAAPGRSAA
jgi:dihydroorotase